MFSWFTQILTLEKILKKKGKEMMSLNKSKSKV